MDLASIGMDLSTLAIMPRHHLYALRHEAWDGALHQGIVAQDDVLLGNVGLIGLDDD